LLHFGTAVKITKQQQIDFHVGVGLSSAAVDHLTGRVLVPLSGDPSLGEFSKQKFFPFKRSDAELECCKQHDRAHGAFRRSVSSIL
jgi:hypothetical protein